MADPGGAQGADRGAARVISSAAGLAVQINLIFALLLPFGSVFAGPHLCQAVVGRWFDVLGWRHTFLAVAADTCCRLDSIFAGFPQRAQRYLIDRRR